MRLGVGKPGVERVMLTEDSSISCGETVRVIGAHHVALAVDILDAERRINGRLIGIGRGAGQIVEVETRKKLVFG